jgi:hypothetical protein
MSKYTVDLTAVELDALRETLAGAPGCTAEVWGDPKAQVLTVAINEMSLGHLDCMPEHADWTHEDGNLYADGAVYPLTVVLNA